MVYGDCEVCVNLDLVLRRYSDSVELAEGFESAVEAFDSGAPGVVSIAVGCVDRQPLIG